MQTQATPLHVLSVGAATAVGGYAAATVAAIKARMAHFNEHPYMIDAQGEPYTLAFATYVDANKQGMDRFSTLLNYALNDCFSDWDIETHHHQRVPLVLSLPLLRPGFTTNQVQCMMNQFNEAQASFITSPTDLYLQGHAATMSALSQVNTHLQNTHCDFCVLAAVDSYIDAHTLSWLESRNQLHSETNAYGFVPGEAACCMLMCTQETLEKYQLASLATVLSFQTAEEPHPLGSEGICIGAGLTEAIRAVVESLVESLDGTTRIDQIVCDQNGEPYRTDEFGFMLTRLSDCFHQPDAFLTPADGWGDIGAASGLLAMILATSMNQKKQALNLITSSSINGLRGALLLKTGVD